MNMQKLLIADCSEDFRQALAQQLDSQYTIQCCDSGVQALELLRSREWDILVLDLLLPELDGISLLHQLLREDIHPKILVASRFINHYVQEQCETLGICYILRKPCSVQALAAHLQELSCRELPRLGELRIQVTQLLRQFGFATRHDGYTYLKEAFCLLMQTPQLSMTKELYPAIGALSGREGKLVERSMRSAIEAAWDRGDRAVWERYFPGSVSRPSNAEFICRLLEELDGSFRSGLRQVL